ncbi:MAG: type III pantothenate kinase, partial [Pseudomonadota bacterium]
MTALVDIGNTRIKLGHHANGVTRLVDAVVWRDAPAGEPGPRGALLAALGSLPNTPVLVSNVGGDVPMGLVSDALVTLGRAAPVTLGNPHDLHGLRCGYRERSQLGLDRWFALLGAWRRGPGAACVIDLGTAGTVDLVDADGLHRGGCIFAGVETQRRALAAGTAALPASEHLAAGAFADNTLDAIAAGARFAVAGAVDRLIAEAEATLGTPVLSYLTGGSAETVSAVMQRDAIHVPTLVMDGMLTA